MANAFNFPFGPLLGALVRNESGGRNVTQGNIGDINNRTGDLAKGYFQITGSTWRDFGGTQYADDPLKASYAQQADIASRIPLRRWGPATIEAMRVTGRPINTAMTLGQNLAMNKEGFGDSPPPAASAVPHQGPTQSGATLDTTTGETAPTGSPPPQTTELTGQDKTKSLGGLMGELQKSAGVQHPLTMPEYRGGGTAQGGPSLAEMIQQYIASQTRGGGGSQLITPQPGGSGFG